MFGVQLCSQAGYSGTVKQKPGLANHPLTDFIINKLVHYSSGLLGRALAF